MKSPNSRNKRPSAGKNTSDLSFWEHLDILRSMLLRCLCVTIVTAAAAFLFKDELFAILLAPSDSDFILYRFLEYCGREFHLSSILPAAFHIRLISTGLTSQFMAHVNMSLYAGLLLASPYIIVQLYRFVSPALYRNERHYISWLTVGAVLLFVLGAAVCYFIIFPLTLRFLAGYVVSADVQPLITLDSYLDTLMMLSLGMGLVFEVPIVSWLLAQWRILTSRMLVENRRYAVVIILIVAAVITPTSDIFTLLVVAAPVYLLYEVSILIVKSIERSRKK